MAMQVISVVGALMVLIAYGLIQAGTWRELDPGYLALNIIGSLQCIESAEAAGDSFPTRPSLLANGVGSIVASCLGSPFATTLYIGHPGWKALGRWALPLANNCPK